MRRNNEHAVFVRNIWFWSEKEVGICREGGDTSCVACKNLFWLQSNHNMACGWCWFYTQGIGLNNGSINGFVFAWCYYQTSWGAGEEVCAERCCCGQEGNQSLEQEQQPWLCHGHKDLEVLFWPMTTQNHMCDVGTIVCIFLMLFYLPFFLLRHDCDCDV